MSGTGHNKPWSKKGEKGTGRGERKQVVVKAADLEISAPTPGTTFPVGGGADAAGLAALLQSFVTPGVTTLGANTLVEMTPSELVNYKAHRTKSAAQVKEAEKKEQAELMAKTFEQFATLHGLKKTTVDVVHEKKEKNSAKKTATTEGTDAGSNSESSSDSDEPPIPTATAKGRRRQERRIRQKEREKQYLGALVGLTDTLKSVMTGTGSDGEDESQAGGGKLKRIIRHGLREVEKVTPAKPPPLTPKKSKKAGPGPLSFREAEEEGEASGRTLPGTAADSFQALKQLYVAPVTVTAVKKTKKMTPKERLTNLAESIKGAATAIDKELYPFPTATPKDVTNLKQYTTTVMKMMEKFDATVSTRGVKKGSGQVSRTFITEGLGSCIGYTPARGQTTENYLTVVLMWLILGGTDFTQDI